MGWMMKVECRENFFWGNLCVSVLLEGQDVDGKITWKWILEK